jgi:hypothetical protein
MNITKENSNICGDSDLRQRFEENTHTYLRLIIDLRSRPDIGGEYSDLRLIIDLRSRPDIGGEYSDLRLIIDLRSRPVIGGEYSHT